MTVEELCESIQAKRRAFYEARKNTTPKNQPTASDLGDCVRETVLAITNWRDRPGFDVELLQRFQRGNEVENIAVRELMELGYTVRIDRSPFELKDKKGRVVLRGHADGFIRTGENPQHPVDVPFECKSLNPNVYKQIDCQEDFDKYVFFRKYPRQLQAYLLGHNLEEGFWLLDDCLGHWKLIPCHLDYERAEKLLRHAEQAVEHIAGGTLPPYHYDPSYCLKCWAFKRICTPPFFSGEGMKIINDPEFADKITRRAELDAAATEYEKLDKEIKETLREAMKPEDNWIIGDFLISATQSKRKAFSVSASESLKFKIERLSEEDQIKKSSEDYEASLAKDV